MHRRKLCGFNGKDFSVVLLCQLVRMFTNELQLYAKPLPRVSTG
jgi:hypothetical protein